MNRKSDSMIRKAIQTTALLLLIAGTTAAGQDGSYNLTLHTLGGYTTPGTVPFWLRANQYGSIPLSGASLSFIGAASKDYDTSGDRLFDWGASFEGRANLGKGSDLTLIEGYGKVRIGIFELRGGRSKKITGLCDSTLTSGSWAISGNSPGIPEVELAVRDYWTLPFTGELFAFKGNLSHGWMGDVTIQRYIEGAYDTLILPTYLHQKSLYGRFGKPSWRLKLYGGFNHQVVWGSEQEYYLEDYTLRPIETLFYVITGKKYSNGYIQEERQGNHLGSIDLGVEYRFEKFRLFLYRQHLYETGALAKLANIEDGLNGISVENLSYGEKQPVWRKLLVEFLYTKNQAGKPWSPEYGSNYEPYYNHGQYINGWSYKGTGIGSPFITPRPYIRDGLATNPEEYFVNNRVMVLNIGGEGTVKNIDYRVRASWSRNFGTYSTTDEEQSTGIPAPGIYGLFGEQRQLSGYLELNRAFSSGWRYGLIVAGDAGRLFYNSLGLIIKASYSIPV